ncbi:MAG: hypothetical protein PHR56_05670 [Dehalococcoidales bacterium]|nr:hypothetical protein [Dehalococcoidales bacterium]
MRRTIDNLRDWAKRKSAAIAVFSYGIIIGTSAPLLLTRCTTGGAGCGSCGGFCSLALGIVPLVLFVTMKNRFRRAGQYVVAAVRRTRSQDEA